VITFIDLLDLELQLASIHEAPKDIYIYNTYRQYILSKITKCDQICRKTRIQASWLCLSKAIDIYLIPKKTRDGQRDYQNILNALIARSISLRRDQREDRGSNQRSARGINTYQSRASPGFDARRIHDSAKGTLTFQCCRSTLTYLRSWFAPSLFLVRAQSGWCKIGARKSGTKNMQDTCRLFARGFVIDGYSCILSVLSTICSSEINRDLLTLRRPSRGFSNSRMTFYANRMRIRPIVVHMPCSTTDCVSFRCTVLNVWKVPRKVSKYETTETPNVYVYFRQQNSWYTINKKNS